MSGEDLIFYVFLAAKLTKGPDDPAAFTFFNCAAGCVFVSSLQDGANVGYGEAACGQFLWIDDNL